MLRPAASGPLSSTPQGHLSGPRRQSCAPALTTPAGRWTHGLRVPHQNLPGPESARGLPANGAAPRPCPARNEALGRVQSVPAVPSTAWARRAGGSGFQSHVSRPGYAAQTVCRQEVTTERVPRLPPIPIRRPVLTCPWSDHRGTMVGVRFGPTRRDQLLP